MEHHNHSPMHAYSRHTRHTFTMFHLVDSTAFSALALSSELMVDSHTLEIISGSGNEEIAWSEGDPQVTTCCLHCANELHELVKSMQYQTLVQFLVLSSRKSSIMTLSLRIYSLA